MSLEVSMNTILSDRAVYFSGVKPANKRVNESRECQESPGQEEGDAANSQQDTAKVLASTLHHCQCSERSQMNPRECAA